MSNDERSARTTGDIVNFMSTDATRIADITQYGSILWSGIFQMTLAFISLYQLIGWQMFIGVGIMVLSFPINAIIARVQTRLQQTQMKNKDQRTRLMNEILNNIRSIKLYSALSRLRCRSWKKAADHLIFVSFRLGECLRSALVRHPQRQGARHAAQDGLPAKFFDFHLEYHPFVQIATALSDFRHLTSVLSPYQPSLCLSRLSRFTPPLRSNLSPLKLSSPPSRSSNSCSSHCRFYRWYSARG